MTRILSLLAIFAISTLAACATPVSGNAVEQPPLAAEPAEPTAATTPAAAPLADAVCADAGGAWHQFPNDGAFCHDECGKPAHLMCKRIQSYGCDCGEGSCWNGEACIGDPAPVATVTVRNHVVGASGAAVKPIAITATTATNEIVVHLEQLTTYCSPEPSFTASVDGEELHLRLERPASAVSRCFGPHTLDAHIALPGRNNVRRVVVERDSGDELGTATVSSGP